MQFNFGEVQQLRGAPVKTSKFNPISQLINECPLMAQPAAGLRPSSRSPFAPSARNEQQCFNAVLASHNVVD